MEKNKRISKKKKRMLKHCQPFLKPGFVIESSPVTTAVNEAINDAQIEYILNPKEETIMPLKRKEAIRRALNSYTTEMPTSLDLESVKDITKYAEAYLMDNYPKLDNNPGNSHLRDQIAVAELVVKYFYTEALKRDIVDEWITEQEALIREAEEKAKNPQPAAVPVAVFDKSKELVSKSTRRNFGLFGSVLGTLAVGGTKMVLEDDYETKNLLTLAGCAVASGTVTTLTLSALEDKDLGRTSSTAIGFGFGAGLTAGATYGLDYINGRNSPAETEEELKIPDEIPALNISLFAC